MDEATSLISQEDFWSKLSNLKYDMYYYDLYFARCISILRACKFITVGGTAIATMVWRELDQSILFSSICPYIILILQILSVIKDLLPYESQKNELRELADELRPIYVNMEREWQKIAIGAYSQQEIIEKSIEYSNEIENVRKHYFKNDTLPKIDKLSQKAIKEVFQYYSNKGWN